MITPQSLDIILVKDNSGDAEPTMYWLLLNQPPVA